MDLNSANDIHMNAGNYSQDFDTLEADAMTSLDVLAPLDEAISNSISTQAATHRVGDLTVSSSRGHFDLREFLIDDNCNWEITIDLPWFKLLEHSG